METLALLLSHLAGEVATAPPHAVTVAIGADPTPALEEALADAGDGAAIVLHDPCRSPADRHVFERALATLREGCAAVVAVAPTTDTLKRADADGVIRETIDRAAMWEPRTPQVYRPGALSRALEAAPPRSVADAVRAGDHGYLPSLVDGIVRVVPLPADAIRVERPDEALLVARLDAVV